MARPWTQPIRELRRRAMIASAIEAFGRGFVPVTPLAIVYLAAMRVSYPARFFGPYVGELVGAMLLLLALRGLIRARHSDVYLAKWIDLTSRFDDRLTSAVEWDRLPERDGFQQRCVDELAMEIGMRDGRRNLVLPAMRPRRIGLTALAAVALAASGGLVLARPQKAPVEYDAGSRTVLTGTEVKAARQRSTELKGQALKANDPELEKIADELTLTLRDIDNAQLNREASLRRLEELRQRAAKTAERLRSLTGVSATNAPGPVGALARAILRGDLPGMDRALAEASDALRAGTLDSEQTAQLAATLSALSAAAETARPVPAGAVAAASAFRGAAQKVEAGDPNGAAERVDEARRNLNALAAPLKTFAAAKDTEGFVAALERSLTPSDSSPSSFDSNANAAALSTAGANSAGERAASEHPETNPERENARGDALRLRGPWNGKVMRALFESGGAAGDEEAKRVFLDYRRVEEERFRRDEVPAEYQDAVRAYFTALHQRESAWTQDKK